MWIRQVQFLLEKQKECMMPIIVLQECNEKDVSKLVSEIFDPHVPTWAPVLLDHPQNPKILGKQHFTVHDASRSI